MYISPAAPHALETRRLFAFSASAREAIRAFFEPLSEQGFSFDEHPHAQFVQELVSLTAAEYALAPALVEPRPMLPLNEPITVDEGHARLSIMKANCNPIFCLTSVIKERPLTLPDVAAYGGDVVKLEAVGLSSSEPPREIGDIARAVEQLERAHGNVPSSFARAVGISGVLRLQGFLWAVKLLLPLQDLDDAIDAAFEAFELSQPVGGAIA